MREWIAACVQEALSNDRVVEFTYRDVNNVITRRVIEPDRIDGDHLYAWCLHRTEIRRFRLSHMSDVIVGAPHFDILLPLPDMIVVDDSGSTIV